MHKYIAMDIETTGLDSKTNQIIQFAVVLPNWCIFNKIVLHPSYSGSAVAFDMNKRIFAKIAAFENTGLPVTPECDFIHAADLFPRFKEWLAGQEVADRPFPIGKNFSGFDFPFLKELNPGFAGLFHYRCLDIGSMYATADGIPSMLELTQKWPEVVKHVPGELHDALYDAGVCMAFAKFNITGL